MSIHIWGTESRREDVAALETVLTNEGISDYHVEIFPETVADSWEDNPLLITSLGSFAGQEAIERALPFLRPTEVKRAS